MGARWMSPDSQRSSFEEVPKQGSRNAFSGLLFLRIPIREIALGLFYLCDRLGHAFVVCRDSNEDFSGAVRFNAVGYRADLFGTF